MARAHVEPILGLGGAAGAGLLAGFLVAGGHLTVAAGLAALLTWLVATLAWRMGARWAVAAGVAPARVRVLAAGPLLPWLASWALLGTVAVNPAAYEQVVASRVAVGLYLLGWLAAGVGALALWLRVAGVGPRAAEHARPARPTDGWWLVVPLLAGAVVAYWNGAVLDPLQFRGFPDYVTQMLGARRLLAGALPYDPGIRVWTDVNLPPITLLLIFVPFAPLSELAGKLAYFVLNHVAFLAGLFVLLRAARPRAASLPPAVWAAGAAALALTFEPWHDSLRLGQQNGIVFFCLAVCAAALVQRRDTLAGVALTAALIGKPSSALLGLYFLFARRWRAAAASAASGALAFLVTLPWTGLENWRFYLFEKAPQILAGTPQQSNVALLALHARLFLPSDALSSFDAMPYLPAAQALTRVAQALGALALWRVTRPARARDDRLGVLLEFSVALALSLSLVGHAWQSYVSWLLIAFVAAAHPAPWVAMASTAPSAARWTAGLLAVCYTSLALNDVWLYKVIGNSGPAAAFFASLPNVALPALAFALALLLAAHDRAAITSPAEDGRAMEPSAPKELVAAGG